MHVLCFITGKLHSTNVRVKTHIQRGGAERPAACDLIRVNKSSALFPRIKSHAAGRSAVCVFLPLVSQASASASASASERLRTFFITSNDRTIYPKEGNKYMV